MKLNPPKAIIDPGEPFKDALFGREEFAKSITSLLQNVSENLVIFVNAPWGAGKTTFSEMWRADLRLQKFDVIYFDSYAADYFDDPFVSFSAEILGLIDKLFREGNGAAERREFKKTAVEVGKRLAGLATKIALRAATLGAIESAHVEEMKDLGSEIASGVSEIGADVIEKKIENYSKEKDALKSFKDSLAKIAERVRLKQGFPLTIIVDELDRCRPSFALELLERIKHLFDVDNLVFVLLVNRDQIESYVKTVYGDVDARAYLLKFGTVFIDLPNEQPVQGFMYVKGHNHYCELLGSYYGLNTRTANYRFLTTCLVFFVCHFNLTLREMERVYGILAIFYATLQTGQEVGGTTELLVALLSVLKVKQAALYNSMRKGDFSAESFYKQTGINMMLAKADRFNSESAKDTLECCIMTESEFEFATRTEGENKNALRLKQIAEYFRNRRGIIPKLCNQLDRFSLSLK